MALYGSIMILVVLLLRALLKNKLPEFVFPVLWGVVLLRLLVPFSISSPLSLPVPSAYFLPCIFSEDSLYQEAETATIDAEGDMDVFQNLLLAKGTTSEDTLKEAPGVWVRKLLPVLYVPGLAAVVFLLGWKKYCYGKKLQNSLLIEHNKTVNNMLREMDMGHVQVLTNDEIASPLVYGLRRPKIYLPTRMDFQNTVLLRYILAHEIMHIRRRDNWLKAVMLTALCVNWYNPLVWVMSRSLSYDLERACDASVLKNCDEDGRKDYAYSLLSMAITGGRPTLLYSAFSKTEVEKRVKGVIRYKKATVLTLVIAILFLLESTVVFASGGQAPFSSYLTSLCVSYYSKWGVRGELARDIALGENAQKRAEDVVFSVLRTDTTDDPKILEQEIKAALAEEFGVEKGAFIIILYQSYEEEAVDYGIHSHLIGYARNGEEVYVSCQWSAYYQYYIDKRKAELPGSRMLRISYMYHDNIM